MPYAWRTDPNGRRRFGYVQSEPAEPTDGIPDLDGLTKQQLVEVAKAQNIDHSGTKADILARLRRPS